MMGRPTKYRADYARQANLFARRGAGTDEILAELFEVDVSTISKWKLTHPRFSEAIKEGKEWPNKQVERSLFERARGYNHPETKVVTVGGEVQEVEITKFHPPDTAAAFIWLKNRDPARWRDKHEVDHSGTVNLKIDSDDDNL